MSSACQCHIGGAFCFYCEVYAPVVAENEQLRTEVKALTLAADATGWEATGYAEENDDLYSALREIDTHIRSTSDPLPHIVATLKQVLPEYSEEVSADGSTQENAS